MPRLGNGWPTQRPTLQGFLALEAQPLRSFLLLPLKPSTLLRRLGKPREPQHPGQRDFDAYSDHIADSYCDAHTDQHAHCNDRADPDPTFDDDHGDTAVFATIITFEESPTILSGELDVLDDIDYFAISNTEPGKTWVFTPEDLPPETSSGRYPPIAISGTSTVPGPFTGGISFQPGGSTLILSMTSKKFPKTGDYRIVADRTGN